MIRQTVYCLVILCELEPNAILYCVAEIKDERVISRGWIKHGKMPWIDYIKEEGPAPTPTPVSYTHLHGRWLKSHQ